MITVQINGKQVELEGPTALLDYVRTMGVDPRAIAVEVNGDILSRDRYGTCTLRHGDVIEIVRMVGGGQEARGAAEKVAEAFGGQVPQLVVRGRAPERAHSSVRESKIDQK
jgi:sulfur carrier protein